MTSRTAHPVRTFLGRAWRNLNRRASRLYMAAQTRRPLALDRLGSTKNGWFAPPGRLEGRRCYCIGVGLDASYDFALAERGAEVHAFDPTPDAIAYMQRENAGRVQFHPWGVLDRDASMRLYFPLSPDHGSHFLHDLHGTGQFHEVPCLRLATILQRLGHDHVDILKMDIEGSWFEVIPDMLSTGLRPGLLQIEYDSPAPLWRVASRHRMLQAADYVLALREGDNAVYVLRGEWPDPA